MTSKFLQLCIDKINKGVTKYDNPLDVCNQLIQSDPQEGRNIFWLIKQLNEKRFTLDDLDDVRANLEDYFKKNKALPMTVEYTNIKAPLSRKRTKLDVCREQLRSYDDPDMICLSLLKSDPEDGKNIFWFIKQFKDGKINLNKTSKIRTNIELYLKNINKDLSNVGYDDIKEAVKPFVLIKLEPTVYPDQPDVIVLYDGEYGKLMVAQNKEASCEIGKGTQWCTSATKAENRYEYYRNQGIMYVFVDKKLGRKKFQFHFEADQFMNENNDPIPNVKTYVDNNPVLRELLGERITDFIATRNYKGFENILKTFGGNYDEITKGLDSIKQDPLLAYFYAKYVVKGKWEEGEPIISTNKDISFLYVRDITKKPWKIVEDYISDNPTRLYEYARYVTKRRYGDKTIEAVIAMDPKSSYDYAKYVVKRRWKPAEKYLKNDPQALFEYASDINERLDPEQEDIIADDPVWALKYATEVIRDRWEEGEIAISANPETAYKYATEVLQEPWMDGEDAIGSDPQLALDYIEYFGFGEGEWEYGEDTIATSARHSYEYAKDIVEGPWSKGEPAILTSPQYAKLYVENVLDGQRWDEAEAIISTSPGYSYRYAKDVLKGRFEKGEPAIASEPTLSFEYARTIAKRPYDITPTLRKEDVEKYKIFEDDYRKGTFVANMLGLYKAPDASIYEIIKEPYEFNTLPTLIWTDKNNKLTIDLKTGLMTNESKEIVKLGEIFDNPVLRRRLEIALDLHMARNNYKELVILSIITEGNLPNKENVEKILMGNPKYAGLYAICVVKNKWSPAKDDPTYKIWRHKSTDIDTSKLCNPKTLGEQ